MVLNADNSASYSPSELKILFQRIKRIFMIKYMIQIIGNGKSNINN